MAVALDARVPRIVLDFVDAGPGEMAAVACYAAGSAHDPAGKEGLAHFLEHMMFKAAGGAKTQDLLGRLDRLGGAANATTSHDTTCYYLAARSGGRSPATTLHDLVRLMAHVALRVRFTRAELEAERRVVIEEHERDHVMPATQVRAALDALHRGSAYARSIGGTADSLARVRARDVRAFFDAHYRECWLVVACPRRLRAQAERTLRAAAPPGTHVRVFKKSSAADLLHAPELPPLPSAPRPAAVTVRAWQRPVAQYAVAVRLPGPDAGARGANMLGFVAHALGQGFTAPLLRKLRHEHGWAYSVSVGVQRQLGYSVLVVSFTTSHLRSARPLQAVLQALAKLREPDACRRLLARSGRSHARRLAAAARSPLLAAQFRAFAMASGKDEAMAAQAAALDKWLRPGNLARAWRALFVPENVAVAVRAPGAAVRAGLARACTKTVSERV